MNEPRPGGHPQPQQPHHPQIPHPPQAPHVPHVAQPARPAIIAPPPSARPGIAPLPTMKPPAADELEPIALVEEEEPMPVATPIGPPHAANNHPQPHGPTTHAPAAPPPPKKIIAFGAEAHRQQHQWKRQLIKTGTGACRVRSFHGKYSEQGLEYLDNAINEWLDNHPEIEVKFVTSTVMTFEGKIREPALVLNVWY